MSDSPATPLPGIVWNVPNVLSAARLVLAAACFLAFSLSAYGAALALFSLATATDWLDGYWARRFDQITQLGRVLDPFADKVIVCGSFIYLAATPGSGVAPWMAVVVMGRELLVTALRSFVESTGGDFSARWAGKWKMVLQCVAIAGALALLMSGSTHQGWVVAHRAVLGAAIVLTLYSGWQYVRLAAGRLRA